MDSTKKRWMHLTIMLALTVIICMCPTIGSITPFGMKVTGVFVGVLYGWIFIDLIWPSIFGFLGLGIIGVNTVNGALATGFGNQQLLMILITMVFAGALEEAGFSEFLSTWLLKKKAFRKNPWMLVLGILVIAYILGMFGATMAAVFLLWSIIGRIAKICNLKEKDPLICFLVSSIAIASFGGSLIFPFHGGALIYEGFFTQATGVSIPYIPFIIFGAVTTILMCVLIFLTGKYILRLDASQFILPEEIITELEAKEVTKKQKWSFFFLIIFMTALLLPELAPFLPGVGFLKTLGLVGISIIVLLIMNTITFDGEPMINLTRVFVKHTQWPLLLLLAVTFPLADALKSQEAGIMVTVSQTLIPIVSDMGVVPFMICSVILLGIATQFTHNIVLGAMFIPFLCPLCEQLGGNMVTLWFMIYLTLNAAYVTPAASMQSAMVHGNELMDKKYAYLNGIIYLTINILVLSIVGIPLGNILF